ncbi:hypothetical protein Acr_26g0001390 [Actinidia rufa]|uniref:Uncharacterized protein n=1 Tax=Actinidia rufa TaxID=165716 RepID=A0A7J0H197_9ERIC|nr:hypothetical protein Acr_26g0001390 [Actinidia rufa]
MLEVMGSKKVPRRHHIICYPKCGTLNIALLWEYVNITLFKKYHITSILNAYELFEFLDGSNCCPDQYLRDASGKETSEVNPQYRPWMLRDQVLRTLVNSTLSPSTLSLVDGQTLAYGVWSMLERRFISISSTNIFNIKKENDSIGANLQRIKEIKDKLLAVSVYISDEKILHIVLKGLSEEFNGFQSTIRTRSEPVFVRRSSRVTAFKGVVAQRGTTS